MCPRNVLLSSPFSQRHIVLSAEPVTGQVIRQAPYHALGLWQTCKQQVRALDPKDGPYGQIVTFQHVCTMPIYPDSCGSKCRLQWQNMEQTQTYLSQDAEATAPSFLTARAHTLESCPRRHRMGSPCTIKSFPYIMLSAPPESSSPAKS